MRALLIFLLMVTVGAACGGSPGTENPKREIVGIVVDIRSGGGFGEVESFTVKDGPDQVEIFVDPEATYDFPLGHLNAHRAGAEPVRVEAVLRNGRLIATEIGDA